MRANAPAEVDMELFASVAAASTLVITSPSSSSHSSSALLSSALAGAGIGGSHGAREGPDQKKLWWESLNKAQDRIKALNEVLGPLSSLEALLDSESPAKCLLQDDSVAQAILTHLSNPFSGHGQDALCQWFYDTFETEEPDLQAVVLRYIPAICGLYLPRMMMQRDESLAGFEAILLAIYNVETKARNGSPLAIRIPDLSQPSLYHAPRIPSNSPGEPQISRISATLEPQDAVRATKRACIIGAAVDLFCRRIAFMPSEAKLEACQCALRLASLSCYKEQESTDGDSSIMNGSSGERVLDSNYYLSTPSLRRQGPEIEIAGPGELFLGNKNSSHGVSLNHPHPYAAPDASLKPSMSSTQTPTVKPSPTEESSQEQSSTEVLQLATQSHGAKAYFARALMQAGNGERIYLSWELLQPLLKILGHCLLAPMNPEGVREAASAAINAMHQRAFHDVVPEAMLATQSLMRLHMATKNVSPNPASDCSWPCKRDILLAIQ